EVGVYLLLEVRQAEDLRVGSEQLDAAPGVAPRVLRFVDDDERVGGAEQARKVPAARQKLRGVGREEVERHAALLAEHPLPLGHPLVPALVAALDAAAHRLLVLRQQELQALGRAQQASVSFVYASEARMAGHHRQ